VALVTHPGRPYKHLLRHDGAHADLRRRGARPRHHLAQQDKGSGIAMVCTFGDVTDIIWWRELRSAERRPASTTIGRTAASFPMPPPRS
jgi:valyl-tRNA synthetase